MAVHIFRRNATYYWRRRVPGALAICFKRQHLFLSLQTTRRAIARRLAARLDLILEDAAMLVEADATPLSEAQIQGILGSVVRQHLGKLERGALCAKTLPGFDVDQACRDDRRAYWVYALLDAQGSSAIIRGEDHARMTADGLSDADIDHVLDHLTMLRIHGLVPTKPHILSRLLEQVGAAPTAMNIDVAQGTYFRGMKLALAQSERRYGAERVEDDGFVDRLVSSKDDPPPAGAAQVDRSPSVQHDHPPIVAESANLIVPTAEFVAFTEAVVEKNKKDDHWDGKTQRQARSIAKLFVKFLIEDQKLDDLNAMRPAHLAAFVDFLTFEIHKNYGKSSKDEYLTITELREKARRCEKERSEDCKSSKPKQKSKIGLSGGTVNRHLNFLGQIFSHASARGVENLNTIDLRKFRAKSKRKTRARDERAKLPLQKALAVFQTPPFNNSSSWNDLASPGVDEGRQVFHCALYFVPLLIYYTGARREELCGAMISDVIFDRDDCKPYLHIAPNSQRRIKNPQSRRNIPLHPELIRLGFLDYVRSIRALGYELLFPDLFSPSSRSPLGNRFYKLFKPILILADITEEGLGAHAMRHLFNAQLKKRRVKEEDRADLMGHGGDSETSERYCEPHEIETLYEFVLELPVATVHLEPRPINLLPWIVAKQVAPFSQPSRAKRSHG